MKKYLASILVLFLLGCTSEVTNFQECTAAGNPVMESYPRQCRAGDQTFTEQLTLTEQAALYCQLPNVDFVALCQEDYIKVNSKLLGGGSTFYKDNQEIARCPVVGPDSISEECQQLQDLDCEKFNLCEST